MKRLMLIVGCVALTAFVAVRYALRPHIPEATAVFADGKIGKVVRVDYMDRLVHRRAYGTLIEYGDAQYVHCGHAGAYGNCITVYDTDGTTLGTAYLQPGAGGLYRIINVAFVPY